MSKIAVLGAGWLGEPLLPLLQLAGHKVWASTTGSEKAARLQALGHDVRLLAVSETGLHGELAGFFAADLLVLSLPPGGRRNPAVEKSYPAKVQHVIAAAKAGGVQRVLFTSSTGIYGEQAGWMTEESPLAPVTHSGKALMIVEKLLREAFGEGLTVLRLAGLIGPGRQAGRWFAGKQGLPDGNRYVNMVQQADVLAFLQQVIDQAAWGHTLNVCYDEHPFKRDFYPAAADAIGLKRPTFAPTAEVSKGKRVDNRRGKELLGFVYQHPIVINPLYPKK